MRGLPDVDKRHRRKRVRSTSAARSPTALLSSGRAAKLDNRQVTLSAVELYFKDELISWLSGDEHLRSGAGRPSWPVRTWLEAGQTMRGPLAKVHLVGRLALERHVWPMFVVPTDPETQFLLQRRVS